MGKLDIIVRAPHGEYPFKNLMMPVLLKIKDTDMLTFLLKQGGFVFGSGDLHSFVSYALNERWLQGLKVFLTALTTQFFFSALPFNDQRILVERLISAVQDIEDAKVRKSCALALVEDILSKKPFTKHLTLALLEQRVPKAVFDVTKLATECLKTLTSEDLTQLNLVVPQIMADSERRYKDIQGNTFENELAKIMMRYNNEGKPEVAQS